MGVLTDYFRAADDAAAVKMIEDNDGSPGSFSDGTALDLLYFKHLDADVTLGHLVSFARDVEWTVDTVDSRMLWSAEETGPWLASVDDATRDTLAGIAPERMLELSARWQRIEEIDSDGPDDDHVPTIEALQGLAQRARDAGEHLYYWICV
ncbi:hypothetical protein ACFQO7_06255 [Catellatospora aurea]|uniref:DUF1877 family protein n=1 Tax=Catellatospora aurea TaxID=1337874 RepID=A0ABW2GTB5_9ACTN